MIMGLDPSLRGTGVCIIDYKCKIAAVCTLNPKELEGNDRLIWIRNQILGYIDFVNYIFIEGFAFGAKGRAVFDLGGLGHILRVALYEAECPYYEIAPTVLKKFITSKGNSNKNILLEQTFRKYKIGSETLKDDNQVDAFGLARLGSAYLEWLSGKTDFKKYELEAFRKVGGKECKLPQ